MKIPSIVDCKIGDSADEDLELLLRQLLTEAVRRAVKKEGGVRIVMHLEICGVPPVGEARSKKR